MNSQDLRASDLHRDSFKYRDPIRSPTANKSHSARGGLSDDNMSGSHRNWSPHGNRSSGERNPIPHFQSYQENLKKQTEQLKQHFAK